MELIDKKAAYEALKYEAKMQPLFAREAYERAARLIDKMHVYRIALSVRHGYWIIRGGDMWCSECDYEDVTEFGEPNDYRYCPHCGARMDGDAE